MLLKTEKSNNNKKGRKKEKWDAAMTVNGREKNGNKAGEGEVLKVD